MMLLKKSSKNNNRLFESRKSSFDKYLKKLFLTKKEIDHYEKHIWQTQIVNRIEK
jgi:hypothetical protein